MRMHPDAAAVFRPAAANAHRPRDSTAGCRTERAGLPETENPVSIRPVNLPLFQMQKHEKYDFRRIIR